MKRAAVLVLLLAWAFWAVAPNACAARAGDGSSDSADASGGLLDRFELDWGGHLKFYGSMAGAGKDSALGWAWDGPLHDGLVELRLKGQLAYEDWLSFEAHHETIHAGGDSRAAWRRLGGLGGAGGLYGSAPVDDDRRLLDLTSVPRDTEHDYLQQRLDRLNVTLTPGAGPLRLLRLGRQAVTWGNGLLFNPMDLLAPFAPTDTVRDYKLGDDMAYAMLDAGGLGDLELTAAPRRDPERDGVRLSQSSFGAKLRRCWQDMEWDFMAARHYEDEVLGLGVTGYAGGLAWRTSAVWTFLDQPSRGRDGFLALTVNVDGSWVWFGKNFYGFVEFYLNTLGDDDYQGALADEARVERLERGELFTLGRAYLAGSLNLELHPLLNAWLTSIVNLEDGSALFQPRLILSMSDNVELTLGAALPFGPAGTEFGGVELEGLPFHLRSADIVSCWLSIYF